MSKIPAGKLMWSLRRYADTQNLWDRVCGRCKQAIPIFEYERCDEEEHLRFSYLCEGCAQKKLAGWLQCPHSPDYVSLTFVTDFDLATVHYEQKNEGETLTLTRWSPKQRQRRLQIEA